MEIIVLLLTEIMNWEQIRREAMVDKILKCQWDLVSSWVVQTTCKIWISSLIWWCQVKWASAECILIQQTCRWWWILPQLRTLKIKMGSNSSLVASCKIHLCNKCKIRCLMSSHHWHWPLIIKESPSSWFLINMNFLLIQIKRFLLLSIWWTSNRLTRDCKFSPNCRTKIKLCTNVRWALWKMLSKILHPNHLEMIWTTDHWLNFDFQETRYWNYEPLY